MKNKVFQKLSPFFDAEKIEAGCDEAGRGCLAGAVFAAAVILPKDFEHEWLNDSKLMTENRRLALREIIEAEALAWGVGIASETEIDDINIANASYLAMHRAVEVLKIKPEALLIDGKHFVSKNKIPYNCIIKGDSKYASIAAASVLAKTYRDDYIANLAKEYPFYHWEVNKGYPTMKHRAAILKHGVSPYHRLSYRLLAEDTLQSVDNQLVIEI
jgi:ribonuclease HII